MHGRLPNLPSDPPHQSLAQSIPPNHSAVKLEQSPPTLSAAKRLVVNLADGRMALAARPPIGAELRAGMACHLRLFRARD